MRHLVGLFTAFLAVGCDHAAPRGASFQPLSKEQVESLATEVTTNTPEHVHFVKGTTFSWVLFEQEDSGPAGLIEAVLNRLREKYTVYRSKEDVPSSRMIAR